MLDADAEARRGRPGTTRAAFTLIESVICLVLVGAMLVAALGTLGAAARARQVQGASGLGLALARELMVEVVAARYEEPVETPTFGPEAPEKAGARLDWDDVDDYDGWVKSPPEEIDGTPVAGAFGWQRQVTVEFVDPATLVATGTLSDTGLKRITVIATSPGGETTTLVALRTRLDLDSRPPAVDTAYLTAVEVQVQAGGSAPAVSSSARLVNRVEDTR